MRTDVASNTPETPEATILSGGVAASPLYYLHACPICGSSRLGNYCRVPSLFRDGEFINYERCRQCGTVLRNPRLPDDFRKGRYEDADLREHQKVIVEKSQVHYRQMMKLIDEYWPDTAERRLLDFGCGSGGFLLEAKNAGFDVTGLELSRGLAKLAEERCDARVYQGLVSDPEFADERFNVIVSSVVFEHLLDPRGTVADLHRHLDPPGMLLIEVPNLRSLRERLRRGSTMDDSHLFYFTAASLSWLLEDSGFEILRVEEGLRPYRFSFLRNSPTRLLRVGERIFSRLQIKTGLSVLARLR